MTYPIYLQDETKQIQIRINSPRDYEVISIRKGPDQDERILHDHCWDNTVNPILKKVPSKPDWEYILNHLQEIYEPSRPANFNHALKTLKSTVHELR